MNKLVLILLTVFLFVSFSMFENTCLYVNICINVSPHPITTLRSEALVNHLDISNILLLTYITMCLIIVIVLNMDLNCRYISFNTRLNTLSFSNKANSTGNLYPFLLFASYILIYEYYFIVFLPFEFWNVYLDTRRIRTKSIIFVRMFYSSIALTTSDTCARLNYLGYVNIVCFCHYSFETLTIWIFLMHLLLCPDIHPNPGPAPSNNFTGGFFSFCNWNLNTLSKDNFTRITLLEAHNTEHKYDIISLCETSLDANV